MTTTVEDRARTRPATTPAQLLRRTTAAVRVSFTWFGVRKTLTPEQKSQAAESFGAEGDFLSARKKLLDTNHAAYKEVSGIRSQVVAFWKSITLPYPEPGVRLIRQDQIDNFNQKMQEYRAELDEAVTKLGQHYSELKWAAQRRLGELYCPNDYPPSLRGLFGVEWDWPNVEPPDYLLELNPDLYEQERLRMAARFEEAVRLAEQAFVGEFAKLVSHLTERLNSGPGDEKKVFRDTVITNLTEFFERFRRLNVRSNQELDELVQRAQGIVQGVEAQELRDNADLRRHITSQLTRVGQVLDTMIVDQPRRRIIRASPSINGVSHATGD